MSEEDNGLLSLSLTIDEAAKASGIPMEGGWVNDPEAVAEIASHLSFQSFGDTPAGEIESGDLPKEVFTWKVHKLVTGKDPDEESQGNIGSCVGFGTTAAVEGSLVNAIYRGEPFEWKELCQEITYGGSRIEIGKGRLGRGDGSIGAWAAQFVRDYGLLPRGVYGKWDLSRYSVATCKQFGASGVPDDLEPEIKIHPVQSITKVTSWDECKKALAQGYCVSVCSNQGFSMKRDSNGVCRPSGSWGHCMAIWGYQITNVELGWIKNSWGPDAFSGPKGAGDPPACGFWAEASVIDRMLRQGDSWAFSSIKGWPKKRVDIDWSTL